MEKMTRAHQLIKPYFKCQICHKSFTNFLDVEKHNQLEHNGMVSTSVAATTISKRSSFILPKMPKLIPMPQNTGHQNGAQGYHQFVSDSALEMKKAREQKQQKENQQEQEIVVLDEPQKKTTNDGRHFVCKICDKTFDKRCNLKNHTATAHSLKGDSVYAKQNSNRVLEQNISSLQTYGKQQQKQQDMLPGKENQHLPQKLDYFECPICAQCFTTFSDIESHMKLKHQKQQVKKKQQIDMQQEDIVVLEPEDPLKVQNPGVLRKPSISHAKPSQLEVSNTNLKQYVKRLIIEKASLEQTISKQKQTLSHHKLLIDNQNKIQTQKEQQDQNQWSAFEVELASLEKANSLLNFNFEKMKNEKEKLENEKSVLLKSDIKFRQIRDNLAMKICQFSTEYEDLENLLNLEPLELISRFEKVLKGINSDQFSPTDSETISDLKCKLKLQNQQRELYEKQQEKIMDMLKIPKEKRCFQEILLAIKHLKKSIKKNIGTEIDLKEAIRTLDENPKKTKESSKEIQESTEFLKIFNEPSKIKHETKSDFKEDIITFEENINTSKGY